MSDKIALDRFKAALPQIKNSLPCIGPAGALRFGDLDKIARLAEQALAQGAETR